MTLIEYLTKQGIIDKQKAGSLEHEAMVSGRKEEEIILEKGIIPEGPLFDFKSKNLKMTLRNSLPEDVPLKILELIPYDSAKYYKMIPLAMRDNTLEIGMVYREDLGAQEAIKFLSRQRKFDYNIFLITITTLENLSKQYKSLKKEVKKALEELEVEFKAEEIGKTPVGKEEFERMAEDAPVTKM